MSGHRQEPVRAQGGLRVELLDANAVLQPGQRIVTLGSVGGHPYVPGVPIGTSCRWKARRVR